MRKSTKINTAKNKKIFKLFFLSILVASIAIFGRQYLAFNSIDSNPPKILGKTTDFISLDKEFLVPSNNNSTSPIIKATLLTAELTDEILIGTQKEEALGDKKFLVLEVRITNETNKDIQINLAEAIKLKQIEKLPITASFHNDPITISSGSNLTTILGYTLDKHVDSLSLLVRTQQSVFTVVPLHND